MYTPYSVESQHWIVFNPFGADLSLDYYFGLVATILSAVLGTILIAISSIIKVTRPNA